MMTTIAGVVGAAFLFGLFTLLRPRDKGCTGNCIGCIRNSGCDGTGGRR